MTAVAAPAIEVAATMTATAPRLAPMTVPAHVREVSWDAVSMAAPAHSTAIATMITVAATALSLAVTPIVHVPLLPATTPADVTARATAYTPVAGAL
jgi:hypothetical protein